MTSAMMPSWETVRADHRALIGLSLSGLAAVAMTYLSEEIHPQPTWGWPWACTSAATRLAG
jgi:YNFM family putative membrane transporter